MQQTNPFAARWTAKGNNLCLGHWEIDYLGQPLALPDKVRENDMGTWGIYSFIDPDDDTFAEGLHEEAWIGANAAWLVPMLESHAIPTGEDTLRAFFRATNPHDWRCGSCGGCL